MQEFHVRHDQMERFFRAESSRQENREIVRHLLAECPLCRETVRMAARQQGFTAQPEPLRLRLRWAG